MDMDKQWESLDRKITSILHLLKGTELDNDQGLVAEFKEERSKRFKLESRLIALEKKYDQVKWTIVGIALPAGYGIIDFMHLVLFKK